MLKTAPASNRAAIRADLEHMTRRWGELDQQCLFELRAFGENVQPQTAKFAVDWIDEAVDWAANMNELKRNVYVVRNPVREDCTGSASDNDIVASFYLWADCDDERSTGNVSRFDGPKWTNSVTTGTVPHRRVHAYWELEEPCTDLEAWRDMQVQIAQHFGSDRAVINPSRIMRLGGTVSHPAQRKRDKGYVPELCVLRTEYDDHRAPVTFDQMYRVFKGSTPAASAPLQSIDTGQQPPMDRLKEFETALSGEGWDNAVLKLVGSYVRKGLNDQEIHLLTQGLTLPGYSQEQTHREVQAKIDRTRANPKFAEDTDRPQLETRTLEKPSSDLDWFDDAEPSLTDSYIVKNLLAEQAMSVIYGPSNSGKTFFAFDLAYHIAIGAPWRGRRVNQAGVLYLAAEGGRGAINRMAALRASHGVCNVPMAVRRAGLDLLKSEADLQAIVDLAGEVRARKPGPLVIVIDTLSRVMAGGDENSPADMTALIRNLDAIREVTQSHVSLVHHSGKDAAKGARGHSSLRAATDTEIEVQNDGGVRSALVTKQRDYAGGEDFPFTLKSVVLGIDQDGDDVTSCVVETADESTSPRRKRKFTKNQKVLVETFDQMVSDGLGRLNPGGPTLPDPGRFLVVQMDDFRSLCEGKFTAKNTRSAFLEAFDALNGANGVFCLASGFVWRTDKPIKTGN